MYQNFKTQKNKHSKDLHISIRKYKEQNAYSGFSSANCSLQNKREKKLTNKAIIAVSKEIYLRLGYLLFCICISSLSAWIYGKENLYLYLYPLLSLSQNVIFTSISEAFSTTLHLSFYIGLVGAAPFFLYGICCFFLPSLFPDEKIYLYKFCYWTVFFYILGLVFCSIYVIPELCRWFLKFSVTTDFLSLSLQARISNYLSWSGKMYILCLCIFEIPIFFLFAFKYVGLTNQSLSMPRFLSQNRVFSSITLLLLCACISPPDLYSQAFLFFFCIIGYECILWYGFLQETLHLSREKKQTCKSL